MSASNWADCPQCQKMDAADLLRRRKEVEDSYGKVPPEDYVEAVSQLQLPVREETLREDYELGIDKDGMFYVGYKANCQRCGFDHVFKAEQALALKEQP